MNTQDLSKFGYRELNMAADLLKKYSSGLDSDWENYKQKDQFGFEGVKIEFNPNSGNVFLVDSDFGALMVNNNNKLEIWKNCLECGREGFKSEIAFENFIEKCEGCKEIAENA